jgi:hypothetical protein
LAADIKAALRVNKKLVVIPEDEFCLGGRACMRRWAQQALQVVLLVGRVGRSEISLDMT